MRIKTEHLLWGETHGVQKVIQYLGNQEAAIAKLESSDYPDKDKLLEKVRAAVPVVGKNQGKRGRPKESDRGDSPEIPPEKVADITWKNVKTSLKRSQAWTDFGWVSLLRRKLKNIRRKAIFF